MHKLMYNSNVSYMSNRDSVYFYTRCIPYDVRQSYTSQQLSFSLKTKALEKPIPPYRMFVPGGLAKHRVKNWEGIKAANQQHSFKSIMMEYYMLYF